MDSKEYVPTVERLISRTREKKLSWVATYDEATFVCVLEGGDFSFEITQSFGTLRLKMKENDESVFSILAGAPSNETSLEDDRMFALLADLYELARRQALKVDVKLSVVNSILDKI